MISATPITLAPSSFIRLAMIKPISPLPKINTLLPIFNPSTFKYFWATPAHITPLGLSPGVLMAPLVLSIQPAAIMIDLVDTLK